MIDVSDYRSVVERARDTVTVQHDDPVGAVEASCSSAGMPASPASGSADPHRDVRGGTEERSEDG